MERSKGEFPDCEQIFAGANTLELMSNTRFVVRGLKASLDGIDGDYSGTKSPNRHSAA